MNAYMVYAPGLEAVQKAAVVHSESSFEARKSEAARRGLTLVDMVAIRADYATNDLIIDDPRPRLTWPENER